MSFVMMGKALLGLSLILIGISYKENETVQKSWLTMFDQI